jgi:exopolysaccharide biosynthesis polyprenyl glycosylphosphotransferase
MVESVEVSTLAVAGGERRRRPAESRVKRLIDVLLSGSVLLVLVPVFALIALAIMVESGGPVLFRQRRTGFGGREFVVLKFRTMRVLEDGGELRQATRNDARVTAVGSFLRRTSLDELPQFINVLYGDMSCVGPRPHALAHDDFYRTCVPRYDDRFRVRPGITGLAQVEGLRGECQTVELMRRRVERDLEYLDGWSIWRDMAILARTVVVTPFQRAAYGLLLAALLPATMASLLAHAPAALPLIA